MTVNVTSDEVDTDEREQWARLLEVAPDAPASEICAKFRHLAEAYLAPLDCVFPIYPLPTSVLPDDFTKASRFCGGWYGGAWVYYKARKHIRPDRGPGQVLIVVDQKHEDECQRIAKAAQAIFAQRGETVELNELLEFIPRTAPIDVLCRVLVHELAHAILGVGEFYEWVQIFEESESTIVSTCLNAALNIAVERKNQQRDYEYDSSSHGECFARVVCHLDSRLRAVGVHMKGKVFESERYGLAPYEKLYAALEPEFGQHDARFATILSTPAPPAFEQCVVRVDP
jgi:hypothetical protein